MRVASYSLSLVGAASYSLSLIVGMTPYSLGLAGMAPYCLNLIVGWVGALLHEPYCRARRLIL